VDELEAKAQFYSLERRDLLSNALNVIYEEALDAYNQDLQNIQ
jgi:hypothetical protein